MRIKSTKLALALIGALSVAAPLALSTTPADAAPHGGGMMMGGGHMDDRSRERLLAANVARVVENWRDAKELLSAARS